MFVEDIMGTEIGKGKYRTNKDAPGDMAIEPGRPIVKF